MRRLRYALVSAPLALSLLACLAPPEPEGDLVGDFLVRGVLLENGCGAAVPANETIELRVQLRRDGGLASWRTPSSTIVHGTHLEGDFDFSFASVVPVFEADPELGTAGCSLDQIERIEVRVEGGQSLHDAGFESDAGSESDAGLVGDAGAAPDAGVDTVATTLEGESTLRYRPSAGSACAPLLAIQGGPFDALPCEVRYRLQGTPTEPLFE